MHVLSRSRWRCALGAGMALLMAAALPLAAQVAPYSYQQIASLVGRPGITTADILHEVRNSCIAFRMDSSSEGRLRRLGADDALIEGLRALTCPEYRNVEPPPLPPVSPPTVYAPRGANGFFIAAHPSFVIMNEAIDQSASAGWGGGAEVGYSFDGLGLFVAGDYTWAGDYELDSPYTATALGGGLRFYGSGSRFGYYVSIGYSRFEVDYIELDRPKRPGNALLLGAGTQYFVRTSVAVHVGARGLLGLYADDVESVTRGDDSLLVFHTGIGLVWYP